MAVPGPPALGRSVVVRPGAPVPAAWSACPTVVVDEGALAAPAGVVGELHAAWSARRPTVVVLGVDPARFRRPRDHPAEPWTLPAGFDCWEDRLHFLVWANTYDARSGNAPPLWWWGRKALRLGAVEASATAGPGDVILPDGRAAWVDGGPRSPFGLNELEGAVLVHAESVERGRLTVAPAPGPSPAELAPDQRAAVEHPSGAARIIAPAGSGKTRVLTERLRHLLVDRRWESDAVLAVAYNKKAQQELDTRCAGIGARTRTLNSLGLWLLGLALGRTPQVLDERDTRRLVEGVAPLRRHRANTDPIGPYLEALSQVRLGLVDPADVEAWRDDVPGLVTVFPAYREALRAAGAVDFDEQIYGAVEALLGDGALRARAQRSCRHLLVDEFQDLTPAHVLLLRLLATPGLDTFGVGDDDQVIYGHAGADPRFLIDYESLWPGAGSHPLEVNYRCPAPVVDAAVRLLSYNERRVVKTIRAARPAQPCVSELSVSLHSSGAGASSLVAVVAGWRDEGVSPENMAVLTRVNSLLLAPHVALAEAGVPISSVLRPDILERTGLRAALAWLRIAVAPEGSVPSRDLVEVLRRPSRGLPPWFADRLRRRSRWATKALLDLAGSVPDKDAAKVEGLVDDVMALRAAAASGGGRCGGDGTGGGTGAGSTARLLRVIREDIGLGKAMTLLDQSRGGEGSSHLDDLEALEQVAGLQDDPAAFEAWLRANFERSVDPGGATLSTVHRVKGREWDRVVVYGVSAGLFPHRLAEDVEEERRVLHVAITRGRERVVVLADRGRPSPFLAEMEGPAPRRPGRGAGAGGGPGVAGG
ncbi:MAG: ATP-dependent helicase, partial [Acidimicrobiales bacterium]